MVAKRQINEGMWQVVKGLNVTALYFLSALNLLFSMPSKFQISENQYIINQYQLIMKKTLNLFAVLVLISGILVMGSCRKAKLNKETTSSEDDAIAESLFDDVFKVVDESAKDDDVNLGKTGIPRDYTFGANCATITLDPGWDTTNQLWTISFPQTLTVDFGPVNCQGNDGRNRRGKVTAVFTGKYRDEGTSITVTTDNYYVNDYQVIGTKTVTNKGRNNPGNLEYSIEVDGKVITPDGDEITWVSSREREWIEGENTTFFTIDPETGEWMLFEGILDDVYSITGSGHGTNRFGRSYTVTITKALRVQFCGWIPEVTVGIVELQPDELKLRSVDFGDGTCDNEATVTIGKKRSYRIKLRK